MLIQTDSQDLGDIRLSWQESNLREREALLKKASAARISHQDELEDPNRSCGPRLWYTEILRRLRNISPRLKVLSGIPGNIALYYPKRLEEYDEAERDYNKDPFFWHYKYVGGMPMDYLPEYSHVLLDSSRLPIRELRGWRTVLIALIKAKAITYRAAISEFGEPNGIRGLLWHEQLQRFK